MKAPLFASLAFSAALLCGCAAPLRGGDWIPDAATAIAMVRANIKAQSDTFRDVPVDELKLAAELQDGNWIVYTDYPPNTWTLPDGKVIPVPGGVHFTWALAKRDGRLVYIGGTR